jgi:hypothetical protein
LCDASQRIARSILGYGGIYSVGPRQNAALEIKYLTEAGFSQKVDGFCGALAAAAVSHDFSRRVEFMDAAREFTERDQVSVEIADLKFVRLAHVEDE